MAVADNVIQCPMCMPDKDPSTTGYIKFGLEFDGQFHDFGDFYYYK